MPSKSTIKKRIERKKSKGNLLQSAAAQGAEGGSNVSVVIETLNAVNKKFSKFPIDQSDEDKYPVGEDLVVSDINPPTAHKRGSEAVEVEDQEKLQEKQEVKAKSELPTQSLRRRRSQRIRDIEDDKPTLESLAALTERHDNEIATLKNGLEALEAHYKGTVRSVSSLATIVMDKIPESPESNSGGSRKSSGRITSGFSGYAGSDYESRTYSFGKRLTALESVVEGLIDDIDGLGNAMIDGNGKLERSSRLSTNQMGLVAKLRTVNSVARDLDRKQGEILREQHHMQIKIAEVINEVRRVAQAVGVEVFKPKRRSEWMAMDKKVLEQSEMMVDLQGMGSNVQPRRQGPGKHRNGRMSNVFDNNTPANGRLSRQEERDANDMRLDREFLAASGTRNTAKPRQTFPVASDSGDEASDELPDGHALPPALSKDDDSDVVHTHTRKVDKNPKTTIYLKSSSPPTPHPPNSACRSVSKPIMTTHDAKWTDQPTGWSPRRSAATAGMDKENETEEDKKFWNEKDKLHKPARGNYSPKLTPGGGRGLIRKRKSSNDLADFHELESGNGDGMR